MERCAEICGVDAETIARTGRDFATTRPALLRLGVGAQRHLGAPAAYSTIASLPALTGAWRDRGGGCSYIPMATASAVSSYPLEGADLLPHPVRTINMAQLGDALTDPALAPPVKALVCWNSNPASIAPDQRRVLEGLRRDDLFTVVLEQFMTDTAIHADVVLPATTQLEHLDVVFSWGHHYLTWSEPAIAPVGEAKPNTETFRLLARRLGLDDPVFSESDEEMIDSMLSRSPAVADRTAELRERGWIKIDLGQGRTPHADGGFGTVDGRATLHARYEPPLEVADAALAERYPLALVTPKTHLFLNSTFANQGRQHSAQPEPTVVVHPDDARERGIADGARVRVYNDRGDFSCAARVSDDARPGVLVAPMGWWNRDYEGGRSGQATTSQGLTEAGPRADLQRQPRGAGSALRLAQQPVVLLGRQDPAHRLVQPRARDAPAPDRGEHGVVGRLLVGQRAPRSSSMSAPARSASTAAWGTDAAIATAGAARSSVIATPWYPSSPRSRSVTTSLESEAGAVKSFIG